MIHLWIMNLEAKPILINNQEETLEDLVAMIELNNKSSPKY